MFLPALPAGEPNPLGAVSPTFTRAPPPARNGNRRDARDAVRLVCSLAAPAEAFADRVEVLAAVVRGLARSFLVALPDGSGTETTAYCFLAMASASSAFFMRDAPLIPSPRARWYSSSREWPSTSTPP